MTEQTKASMPTGTPPEAPPEPAVPNPIADSKDPARKLHTKIAQIMWEAERIPKNGRAPAAMGGYPFVQVGDAADMIRRALAEKRISMVPSHIERVSMTDRPTKQGGISITVDLLVVWTLTDGETGETATIMSYGAGADGGDKFSGKAMTNAMKYAFLSGFLLSTGEDTEGSATPDLDATGEVPEVKRSRGPVPAQGGRQVEQNKSQTKVIGDLLKQLHAANVSKGVPLIEELLETKVELAGDDKPDAFAKWLAALDSNTSGKLINRLQKRIKASTEASTQTEATDEGGNESSPGAPAGAAPDAELEADEPAV